MNNDDLSKVNLFDLTKEAKELLDGTFNPETGEIIEEQEIKYEEAQEKVRAKCLAYCHVIKSLSSHAEAIEKAAKDNIERAKVIKNKVAYMKQRIVDLVPYKTEIEDVHSKIQWRQSESINIIDEKLVPPDYMKFTSAPDKAKIKAAIKKGEEIAGSEMIKKKSVTIK